MERVLVEELVHSRQYYFDLDFELPLNLSMALHPQVTGTVQNVRQYLRPEGLMICGDLVEVIQFSQGRERKELDHSFDFTYIIPEQDLVEANLLNYEIQVSIEQIQYHFIKKKGQVLLKQWVELRAELAEFHVRGQLAWEKGGMRKKTGIFLKPSGKCQESFLKIYSAPLPDDFSLLSKLSGVVEEQHVEITPDGCLVDLISRIQGEYVTENQKLGSFFFQHKENLFLPMPTRLQEPIEHVQVEVELRDISLEEDQELMVLYHCQIFLYQKCEVNYYTVQGQVLDHHSIHPTEDTSIPKWKDIEVEQISQTRSFSKLLEEEVGVAELPIRQIKNLTGQSRAIKVEQGEEQLFLTGELEYQLTYITEEGTEQSQIWVQRVEEMILLHSDRQRSRPTTSSSVSSASTASSALPSDSGYWQFNATVQIPHCQLQDGKVSFDAVIDFHGSYHQQQVEPILMNLDPCPEEIVREPFYVTEKLASDQVQFHGEEKIYLQRYASQMIRCHGQVLEWQTRRVEGGWMIRGQGELTVYYLSAEGERHFGHPFRFYQYIPCQLVGPNLIIRANPRVQILDHEMLEDGSVVQIQYLGQIGYTLFQREEMLLVTEMGRELARGSRPILEQGKVKERQEYRIMLAEARLFPYNRVRHIDELKLNLQDYQIHLGQNQLRMSGKVEVQVKYRTGWGKERWKQLPLDIQLEEEIAATKVDEQMPKEGVHCQQIRAVPIITGYEYKLTGHPQHHGQVVLTINIEVSYRLVGRESDF